jgi:hypothetical protein
VRSRPALYKKVQKGCTRLAAASDKVYQLLAHGRWFSPDIPASSTTKTGRHDIAEILPKVALNTKIHHQIILMILLIPTSVRQTKLLAHGRWFSPGTQASSTTKTGRHDIAEILLKVALSTIIQIKSIKFNKVSWIFIVLAHYACCSTRTHYPDYRAT